MTAPVAHSAGGVARLAARASLEEVDARVCECRACPRLVSWREQVAREKRASYADETYWGRPIPGWGSTEPGILIVGLAPAAHGGNRTGRVFTGDRSGDWLFASLYRVGLANQPTSTHLDDGLELRGTRIVAAVRCAPPQNKPTTEERDTCAPWIDREVSLLLPGLRAVVCLGSFGWVAAFRSLAAAGLPTPRPRPRFGHGVEVPLGDLTVLGCFHPSQQNTFTGRLTQPMLDAVLGRAAELASL
ncbi:uracil-DNA glycosylase [Marmoricola sp. URHB0036]|uniref:uracil-DNA glycosylase n=1 Tax=Marmoricola sp. URHB0036 TaxID=1298863 RepID=UPI0004820D86|nr:uracil-DNA glycosylase [Marmoricola sp. URHB0036]